MAEQARRAAAAAGSAALAAGVPAAVNALQVAAANASKPGSSSSELKAVVGGVLVTGLMAALHAFSVIPGPWMLPAMALSTGISVAGYALSRGNVKAAALQGAAAAVSAAMQLPAAGLYQPAPPTLPKSGG